METSDYETFEYIHTNNTENVSDQLFVVEDNGTFITLNNPVDIVTQVQNVEILEEVQPVYDVSPEQFYIHVDGSSELITVSDHFVLNNEVHSEKNNIYGENFILQPVTSSSELEHPQPVDHETEDVVEQFIKKRSPSPVDVNINMEADNNQTTCTEITITDEQYKILEQKGWTLIENNGNVYLVDTMGLHDITHDEELIQKLKLQMSCTNFAGSEDSNVLESESTSTYNANYQKHLLIEQSSMPFLEETCDTKAFDIHNNIKEEKPSENSHSEVPGLMPSEREFLETTVNELSEKYENSDPRINSNTIKIKTKFSLKDIPPEIVLGRTANGKKLVARVTKRERSKADTESNNFIPEKRRHKIHPTNAFHDKIDSLIQQAINGEVPTLSEEEVLTSAQPVVQQLLRVPAFKPAVIERRLIITKIGITEDKDQNIVHESEPIIITGRVLNKARDKWDFQYLPNMLQNIRINKEADRTDKASDDALNFLQIHIQEVNSPVGVAKISITLNRRAILLKSKKSLGSHDEKASKVERVYACSACAAVFNTELRLKLHQELHNVANNKNENEVKREKLYQEMVVAGVKGFVCNECQFQTVRQSVIQRHIKSHFNVIASQSPSEEELSTEQVIEGKHKCKMCSISYTNAATLSKHIVTKHIKVSET
ncbi:unnamed protein product [Leptosia nina]|uniref:C2H2-type domain-containing protein n=1 Tax=Leptosia nina TaxID=320188 RepID=A0AAV1K1Y5_9NEOP